MSSLAQILNEADEIIRAKTASGISKTASAPVSSGDDIFKLAEEVRRGPPAAVKEAAADVSDDEIATVTEKIAHALAITETYANLGVISRLDDLEKQALAKGNTPEQVNAYFEKNASRFGYRSIFDIVFGRAE